jgi:hypothetical protein
VTTPNVKNPVWSQINEIDDAVPLVQPQRSPNADHSLRPSL